MDPASSIRFRNPCADSHWHQPFHTLSALPDVLQTLRALLDTTGGAGGDGAGTSGAGVSPEGSGAEPTYTPTPLSQQVRDMRRQVTQGDDSVKRNVTEAFKHFVGVLDEHYAGSRVSPASHSRPNEFLERINHWHAACGLPEGVRSRLQTLRIWRNAVEHGDEERWLREGPRTAEFAAQHLAALTLEICSFTGS